MLQPWPEAIPEARMQELGATESVEQLNAAKYELVRAVRNLRANYQLSTSMPLDVVITPASPEAKAFLDLDHDALAALLNAKSLTLGEKPAGPAGVAVSAIGTAFVPLAGLVDFAAETARLQKQEAEATKYIATLQKKREQGIRRTRACRRRRSRQGASRRNRRQTRENSRATCGI